MPIRRKPFRLPYVSLLLVAAFTELVLGQATTGRPPSEETVTLFGASVAEQVTCVVRYTQKNNVPQLRLVERHSLGFPGRATTYHAKYRKLYVVPNGKTTPAGHQGTVFSVAGNGQLKKHADVRFAHGYDYLSIAPDGRHLLGASYFEGHIDVYTLDSQGIPQSVVATRFEDRDKAHSVLVSPNQRFAYVPFVKDQNALYQYSFNSQTGALTPLDPPQATVPPHVGPRHLAFHPQKPFVLFSNEQQLGISSYRMLEDGRLDLLHVCPAPGAQPQSGLGGSDIVITPDGKYAYASVRGFGKELNAVFRYAILGNGKLRALGKTDTDTIPWALALSPSGHTLFVSATEGGTLTAYQIQADGALTETATLDWGKDFRDLAVLPAP